MDSLPPGVHPLVLRLFQNEPIGNENLLMEFPFQVDGRTLEVSVNRMLWPASDSVIVDLPPGWYNIKFLGIDTSSILAPPIIRGRSSVIVSDFPSFTLRLECLPMDEEDPEMEPEPELVTSWNRTVSLSRQPGDSLGWQISLDWYDDFGREESTQAIKASPSGKDLFNLTEYDPLDRKNKEWLSIPVPSTVRVPFDPGNTQIDPLRDLQYVHFLPEALKGRSVNCYGETERPYSEIQYGTSSLNRPGRTFGPGIQWHTNN